MKTSPWLALKESLASQDQRPGKEWLTIDEVAKEMQLSIGRAREVCNNLILVGRIEKLKIGKRRYYKHVG